MNNLIFILNTLVMIGVVTSAVLACTLEKMLSSVISIGITGIFAGAAFLLMHAPDVAISELAVGAALIPMIFVVALKKFRGGDDK